MKQLLLILVSTFLVGNLTAQEVLWQEDFSSGQHGWTVNTTYCDNYNGPNYGIWELAGGFIDGEEIDLGNGYFRWSFISPLEYQITFADDSDPSLATTYGTVYSRYTLSDGTLMSMIDGSSVVGDGTAFSEQTANGIVDWATNLELGGEDPAETLRLMGVGAPVITYTNGGQNFTYNGENGAVALEFTKISECGSFWTWSPNGNVGYGVLSQTPGSVINSPTRANGVMTINTLFQNSGGNTAYNPGSPPYPQYVSELISPSIDISARDRPIAVELNQRMAFLNTPADAPDGLKTSFSISTDDGLSWSPAFDLNTNFPTNTIRDGRINVLILEEYLGAADEIRIKFTWATDFWYWAIDDVAIVERIPYDMQANANFFGIPSNVNTPISQVEDTYWMSDIQNNGAFTAENVQLNFTLRDESGTVELYNEDKAYGDITVDSLAENDFFATPLLGSSLDIGNYVGTYALRHDSLESRTTNDSLEFSFSVTDTLFAKETGATRSIFLVSPQWYIGNSFYVPNGDGWYARHISFMVANASNAINGTGRVNVLLYESDGDVNGDGTIDDTEFSVYGINEYVFTGEEDGQMITVGVDLDEGLPLTSGKHYIAMIQYSGQGVISEGVDDQLAISASEDYNYNANYFIMDSLMTPRYMNLVATVADDPSFAVRGFGGATNPVVRLSIGNNPNLSGDAIVATSDLLSDEYKMNIFPNPANEEFNIELDFPERLDANVRLFDQSGRLILARDYEKLSKGIFTYDSNELPSGTYWIQLTTSAGTKTEKVIVSH